MPESQIILANACTYVATAPKSNAAVVGIDEALNYIKVHGTDNVPPYLKDAHYQAAAKLGRGIDYKYAHDYPNNYVKQQYLPDEVCKTTFTIHAATDMNGNRRAYGKNQKRS